ncbi:hypothetical protein CLU80_1876 [Pseudomonas sp. 29]|uniref:hypothetical protein n=1 Tax=Pseudomonas sp. 29 TaxID=2035197 RepID=UPI000C1A0B55|nr:hypothetical protein [Pseudomonas sp. 29]PIF49550.1 hypothetical protein CLU80_1876 [Pseudomonas sp. 29]
MTWKGTLRSMQASARRAERNSKRRQRELQVRQKEFAKMEALEQAAYEVEVYENHIDLLLSVHKDCGEIIDWSEFANQLPPIKPETLNTHENQARAKQSSYKPGFFARTLKLEARQRKKIELAIQAAVAKDTQQLAQELSEWEAQYQDWKVDHELALGILAGNAQSKIDAVLRVDPFTDISHLGTSINFSVAETGILECTLSVHGIKVIPQEIKSLLQSGKLSVKKMPISKFNELLQDYVSSCVLRVGQELLSILPERLVIVTAVDSLLNSATGHLEDQPILSVALARETLFKLNMQSIDPSDSMKNFVHTMNFKKTTGFMPVDKVDSQQFASLA